MITHNLGAPADARTITRMKLLDLDVLAEQQLKAENVKLDDYSKAHLLECRAVIKRALEADVSLGTAG